MFSYCISNSRVGAEPRNRRVIAGTIRRARTTVLAVALVGALGQVASSRADSTIPAGLLYQQTYLTNVPPLGELRTTVIGGDTIVAATNIYTRSGTNWTLTGYLQPSNADQITEADFGLAISEDANLIALGAGSVSNGEGEVFIFERQGTNWVETAALTPEDGATNDRYGVALDLEGDLLLVGAPQGSSLLNTSSGAGAAYLYRRSGNTWNLVKKLVSSDRVDGDFFAEHVDLSGDLVICGASGHDVGGKASLGAAYIFARDEGGADNWGQRAKLVGNDTTLYSEFGKAVGLSTNYAIIGSRYSMDVFQPDDSGNWNTPGVQLIPDDVSYPTPTIDVNSIQMTRDGMSFVAGDFQEEGQVGAAYVFALQDGNWVELKRLQSDSQRSDFFGWTVGLSGNYVIAKSTFPGGVYVFGPDYHLVRKNLYYSEADNSNAFPKDKAAFRYKDLLYAVDDSDPAKRVRARFDEIGTYYGQPERDRAAQSEDLLAEGIAANPDDVELQETLLDLFYDRTVAEALFAKNLLVQTDNQRLGPPSTAGGFVIDDEIDLLGRALATNRFSLATYFPLFTSDFGQPGLAPPVGFQIFKDLVPGRALLPATYTDGTNTYPVTTNSAPLFDGYKDLVMLFGLLRDHGRVAAEQARLYVARNNPGDRDAARTLLGRATRFIRIQRDVLLGIFPGLNPDPSDPSGLQQAMAGTEQSLSQLAEVQQLLDGDENVLGFTDDFMLFVQQIQGQNPDLFDTFNRLKDYLDPSGGSNPLADALNDYAGAVDAYATYQNFEDKLFDQLRQSTTSFGYRLYEIDGANPGDPGYDTPELNQGSEIWQQLQNIEAARLKIRRNHTNMFNLQQRIEIEVNRASSLQDSAIKFSDEQAKLTEYIGHINAVQAEADGFEKALSFEGVLGGRIFGYAANAAVQGVGEELKGQIEAQKERLAGMEQAEVVGIESAAIVKNLLLEMNTLALDSEEAALQLRQETGRLAGLYSEKGELERRMAENDENLAQRYYADPVHRQNLLHELVLANQSFDKAQQWLFIAVRALEYKWNRPFAYNGWDKSDLFRCLNADELERFYAAMRDYDVQQEASQSHDDRYDWFSIREHFFGYRRFDNNNQLLYYTDPKTGEQVDAIEAFRRRLADYVDANGVIHLRFSTVRHLPNSTFFKGPDLTGPGLYLDKIKWLKIRLPGTHTTTNFPNSNPVIGSMTYGGTSYIRNESPGTVDPDRPDRIVGEMTPYSTRFWYNKAPTSNPPDPGGWRATDAYTADGVPMLKVSNTEPRQDGSAANPDVLPSVAQIDTFQERSVATTGWELNLPTVVKSGGDTFVVLRINELDDIEIYFYHYASDRH